MKKSLKALLALGMSAALLAGCGGGTPAGGDSAGTDVDVEDLQFPLAETATLKGLTNYPAGTESEPNNRTIFKRLEEQTNVHIDWKTIQSDQWGEKIQLEMSNVNTLPDFVFNAGFGDTDLLKYAKQGVIIHVEEYIDKYMPNLSKVFEQAPEYRAMCEDADGHIWALPWIEQLGYEKTAIQTVGNMPFINKAWLDFLGLEIPTNVDDFEKVLLAFRDNAETLLGADADKMIPYSTSTDIGWRNDLLCVAYVPTDVKDEDLFVYGYDDRHLLYPGWINGVKTLNKWYNEGLVWKDFGLYNDSTVEDDNMKAGYVGAFMHNWDYPFRNGEDCINLNLQRNVGEDAMFVPIDCFQNADGVTKKFMGAPVGSDRKIFFPATNKEPLASLLYVNFISSEEAIKYLQTGLEGTNYNLTADGAYEILPATGEWVKNSGNNIDYTMTCNGLYLGDATAATTALSYPGIPADVVIQANIYGQNNGYFVKHFNVGTIESETEVGTSLTEKRDALLTQAVTASVEDFDQIIADGMEDYMSSGGQDIMDERIEKLQEIYGYTFEK